MMDLIRRLVEERTVVLVEHKMKLVMGIWDRILVLASRRLLAEGTPDDIRANEMVRRVYLGQGLGRCSRCATLTPGMGAVTCCRACR